MHDVARKISMCCFWRRCIIIFVFRDSATRSLCIHDTRHQKTISDTFPPVKSAYICPCFTNFTNFFNFSSILFVFHLTINLFLFIILLLPIGAWLSLVERCVRDAEVASSNLVAPTKNLFSDLSGNRFLFSDSFWILQDSASPRTQTVATHQRCVCSIFCRAD